MPAAELQVFVEQGQPRLLIVEEALYPTAVASAPGLPNDALIAFEAGGKLVAGRQPTYRYAPDPARDLSTPVMFVYTSGTSGTPKGAVLTNGCLLFNALNAVTAFAMTGHDEVLTAGPMFHVGGLNIHTTPALFCGATTTIHRQFHPGAALADIERFGVTLFIAVPTMTAAMLADPSWEAADLSSLRSVATGSTIVPAKALSPWLDRGVPIMQVYGLTETSPIATVVPAAEVGHKAAAAGRPAMHCHIRIVDAEGHELPRGHVGEVLISGPNVMVGYWQNPSATAQVLNDGWLRSGDAGLLDEDGHLHIVERLKEIIVVGGSNVYPADVEHVLMSSPDIAEAAVVARPDPELGQVPAAYVVPVPGRTLSAEDVIALFDQRVADYKRPRDIVFLEALPRTAFGKVQKHALRSLAAGGTTEPAST